MTKVNKKEENLGTKYGNSSRQVFGMNQYALFNERQ